MNFERYGLTYAIENNAIPISNLKNMDILIPFVKKYGEYFKTDDLAIASSMFVKRYAVMTAAASVEYYGFQNLTTDWFNSARLNISSFSLGILEENQNILSDSWIEHIFNEHLAVIVECLSIEAKISKSILWENVAVRINAVFREHLNSGITDKLKDLYIKLSTLSYENGNTLIFPFQKTLSMSETDECSPKRKTCCKYYQVNVPGDLPYCLVCPIQHKKKAME